MSESRVNEKEDTNDNVSYKWLQEYVDLSGDQCGRACRENHIKWN